MAQGKKLKLTAKQRYKKMQETWRRAEARRVASQKIFLRVTPEVKKFMQERAKEENKTLKNYILDGLGIVTKIK